MKNAKRLPVFFLVLLCFFALCFTSCGKETNAKNTITITVIVVDDHGEETTYTLKTARTFLSSVLADEKLVSGEDSIYGIKITSVNGVYADWNEGTYWALYEDGVYATVGAHSIVLRDGGIYKLVYTKQ